MEEQKYYKIAIVVLSSVLAVYIFCFFVYALLLGSWPNVLEWTGSIVGSFRGSSYTVGTAFLAGFVILASCLFSFTRRYMKIRIKKKK
jgi:hypothetical protein